MQLIQQPAVYLTQKMNLLQYVAILGWQSAKNSTTYLPFWEHTDFDNPIMQHDTMAHTTTVQFLKLHLYFLLASFTML